MDRPITSPEKLTGKSKVIWFGVGGLLIVTLVLVIALTRNNNRLERPQEPKEPFPYYSENVSFENAKASVPLSGTLTLPTKEGTYPAVILISGSGPQTRDGEFAGHKQFLVLSDYLTKNGIAVLRYDDRGFGKSTGNFWEGTSLDFSYDVESAIEFLKTRKEIDKRRIGLIGHSDGAMIAPMVAARTDDVNFMVLLAGPGIAGPKLLLDRQEIIERKAGLSEQQIRESRSHSEQMINIVINASSADTARAQWLALSKANPDKVPDYAVPKGMSKDEFIKRHIDLLSTPWFKFFFTYDPAPVLQKVRCPVLALNGDLDVQVPSMQNLEGLETALKAGGNHDVTVRQLPGLNHAFQDCKTGMPDEYVQIIQTFSPTALAEIQQWLKRHTASHLEN